MPNPFENFDIAGFAEDLKKKQQPLLSEETPAVQPQEAYDYLTKNLGYSHVHAIGFLNNFNKESAGLIPSIHEIGKPQNEGGIGLAQHTGERRKALEAAVPDWKTNWKGQLDFINQEPDTQKYLKQSFNSPEEASHWVTINWERPANKFNEAKKRVSGISSLLSQISGGVAYAGAGAKEESFDDYLTRLAAEQTPKEAPSKVLQEIGISDQSLDLAADKAFSWGEYLWQQIKEGATLGIVGGEMSGRNIGEKVIGGAVSFAASIPTFALLATGLGEITGGLFGLTKIAIEASKAAKTAKTAYKIGKGLSAAAKTEDALGAVVRLHGLKSAAIRSAAKSIGLESAKVATEGGLLGAGVEGIKSATQGNDAQDVLIDSVAGGITWAATGAALTPLMHGAGSFLTRGRYAQYEKAGAVIGSDPVNIKILNSIKEMGGDGLANFVSKANKDANLPGGYSSEQIKALNAISKIKKLNPQFNAFPEEILANPDILSGYNKTMFEDIAKAAFDDPNNPLSSLKDTNPNLKALLERGDYAGAISTVQTKYNMLMRDSKDLQTLITGPLKLDANSTAAYMASRLQASNKKFANLEGGDNLITSFYETRMKDPLGTNPTVQQELAAIKEQIKQGKILPYGAKKTVSDLGKVVAEEAPKTVKPLKFTDKDIFKMENFNPTMNSKQVEILVADSLEKNFKMIANDKFNLSDLSHFNDLDQLARSMIPLNRSIFNTMAASFQTGGGSLSDNFLHIPPELQDITIANIKKNAYEMELKDSYAKLQMLKKSASDPNVKRFYSGMSKEDLAKFGDEEKLKDVAALQSAYKNIADRVRKIKEIEVKLSGSDPDQLAKAKEIAGNAYLPNREILTEVGEKMSTQAFFEKYGFKGTPYLLKNNTELSNFLHGLNMSGHEVNLGSFINPESFIRQTRRQFGFNNPLEQITRQFQQAEVSENIFKNLNTKILSSLGIETSSPLDVLTRKYIEGSINDSHKEFLALSPTDKEKVKNAASVISDFFADTIREINVGQKANNLPLINIKENYVHHPRQMEGILSRFKQWATLTPEEQQAMVDKEGYYVPNAQKEAEALKTFAGFEKKRKGVADENLGAIEGALAYMDPAAKRIFRQDLIRQIDAARVWAGTNMHKNLTELRNLYVLGKKHVVDEAVFKGKLGSAVARTIDVARQKFSQSALLGSASTLVRQPTSIAANFGLGTKEATSSLFTMYGKEASERWAESVNKKLRNVTTEGNDHVEMKTFIDKVKNGVIKGGFNQYKGFLESALNIADDVAARHAYETGYKYGLNQGLDEAGAKRVAEWWVDATQANMSKLSQPEWNRSVLGRSLSQFQTFTTNMFGTLINDIPNIANSDGAAKAMAMMLRGYAAISLTNEVLRANGFPEAYDTSSYIPILPTGFGMGVSGPVGIVWDASKYIYARATDNDRLSKEAKKELTYSSVNLTGFPGAGQIAKTYTYATSKGEKEPGGYVFGKTYKKQLNKYQQEKKNNKKGFIRRAVGEYIKGY